MAENQGKEDIFTDAPALSPEDERLVDAYRKFGVPTDQLITSGAFHRLARQLREKGDTRSDEELMKRLLNLRKAGRLPRFSMPSPSPSPSPHQTRQITVPSDKLIETVNSLNQQGVHSMTLDIASDGSCILTYLPAAG